MAIRCFSCRVHYSLISIFFASWFVSGCAVSGKNLESIKVSATQAHEEPNETFSIPKNAKIQFNAFVIESGGAQIYNAEYCIARRPTEIQLRRQFQVAHLVNLKSLDRQEKYPWTPCYWDGIIQYEGKITKWKFRLGNVIETTFPDGILKVLVGDPSGQRLQ